MLARQPAPRRHPAISVCGDGDGDVCVDEGFAAGGHGGGFGGVEVVAGGEGGAAGGGFGGGGEEFDLEGWG